ncbi:Gtpase-activating protein gyp5, partial [Globisporangium splendens]
MPPSAPSTTATASGWGSSAFVVMKDRATIAKNHLTPQILNMREKTSKRMEKYQPSIDKVKSSASAAAILGREKMTPALSRVKEGSTQGWSMLKTKLASAAPVAEKIQTMGLSVVTDMWVGDLNVDVTFVEHPSRANCRFLNEYKASPISSSAAVTSSETRLSKLRLTRTSSSTSTASSYSTGGDGGSAPAEQCFANRFIVGTIVLFCGDVQVHARIACVNRACRVFIASEKRLLRFCVRYGDIPQSIRVSFWEHVASVQAARKASELDFDTYLHMALSKGDCTELIMTDVRRTYGRVAPHKHAPNAKGEVVVDTDQELIDQLSEILHALSCRFPDVGYCQGMDYIAAHVLDNVKKSSEAREQARSSFSKHIDPSSTSDTESDSAPLSPGRSPQSAATRAEVESAFWILVCLFENYGLRQMFSPGLHRLQVHCFQAQRLFELGLPELAAHFETEKVVAEMFTVGWFQTLFLYLNVLPRESLDRVWDIFLFEKNWKIMLRVAVALLQISEPHVIGKPIDEVMQFLNTFAGKSTELLAREELISKKALGVKVTNNMLTKLQRQHAKRKKATPERK